MRQTALEINPATPFSKRLRWQCGEAEHAEFLTITPAMAEEMLERNTDDDYRNRPISKLAVGRYVRAMQRNGWVVTGEPIIFSSDGVLLNGQHRLTSCAESGCSFRTVVVYGINRSAFKFMDRGLKRTAADVFSIEGIPNASLVAAATLWQYRISELGGWSGDQERRLENDQLLERYYFHEDIQKSTWVGNLVASEGEHLISNSLMVALHYLFAQKSRQAADDFMRQVITGIGISSAASPEHKIRKWLLKDNMEVGGRTNDVYRAAYLVMAWNARRTGTSIKIFRWRTDQNPNVSFPTIR